MRFSTAVRFAVILLIVTGLLIGPGLMPAGAATVPAPDPASSQAAGIGPEPRGTLVALPVVITSPGTYTLDRDYRDLVASVAIDVRASNVVIDGGGHLLDGVGESGSVGVRAHADAALSGVTVRNIRVAGWSTGVYFWNAGGRVEDANVSSNARTGIMLSTSGNGTVVAGCTVEGNGASGISAAYAPGIEIASCSVRNNSEDGISLYGSDGCRVTGTTIGGNTLSGIALVGSGSGPIRGALVSGCTISSSGKAGISMNRAEANTVVDNRFENVKNALLEGSEVGANTWSTPKTVGKNIVGGPYRGGNWWSGFSETAPDADRDGLADQPHVIGAGNSDALPLVTPSTDFTIRPGTVITTPGTYTLDEDIFSEGNPVVVRVVCSDVVIDGKGHRISGSGGQGYCGIYVFNPTDAISGVVVRDLTLANFTLGIFLTGADAGRIERCRVLDIPTGGIGLVLNQGSDGNTITGNRILAAPSAGPGTIGTAVASSQNAIYDNEFCNPSNVVFVDTPLPNAWNTAKTTGTNIIGGLFLGGNYWADPTGTGWSQVVRDADHDGIGDAPYVMATGNSDPLPLVRPRPDANFTASPTSGTAPLTVRFTDTSTGSPASWAWSFGDGATSTARDPEHTYAAPGTYTVSLMVVDAAGEADTETRDGMIAVSAPVSISAIAPAGGARGTTVGPLELAGAGFQAGATVALARAGYADIPATGVAVESPARITCRLALPATAATGAWNVVVTNPDGGSGVLYGRFTVTGDPGGVPVTYSGQRIVISEPGSYYLTNDIANSPLFICIEIQTSNVVFDGGGHLVDGIDAEQSAGIYVHGPSAPASGVTVRNVRVQDWWYGLYFQGAQHSRIESSTLSNNAFAGAVIYQNAAGNTVADCDVVANEYGLVFSDGSNGGVIAGCRVDGNDQGVFVYISDSVTMTGNRIENNHGVGLQLHTSGGGSIYDNLFSNTLNLVFNGEPYKANAWSTTPGAAWSPANIAGGPLVGGNFWGTPAGTGYSQSGADANGDGFVDDPLTVAENNVDYHPLASYAGPRPVPGGAGTPSDPDGDGIFEDVNGNGVLDFADIVLYFQQISWIAENEPVPLFDYNRNGGVDFADVTWLFFHL